MITVYELRSPIITQSFIDQLRTNEFLRGFNLQWIEKDQKHRLRYINENDELSYLWLSIGLMEDNIWSFTKYGCCNVSEMILKLEWVFGIKFWDEHTIQKYSFTTY